MKDKDDKELFTSIKNSSPLKSKKDVNSPNVNEGRRFSFLLLKDAPQAHMAYVKLNEDFKESKFYLFFYSKKMNVQLPQISIRTNIKPSDTQWQSQVNDLY